MKYMIYGVLVCYLSAIAGCRDFWGDANYPGLDVAYETRFTFDSGLVRVPVSINGAPSQAFILDSGSTDLLISESYAQQAGIQPSGETVKLQGVGGERQPVPVLKHLWVDMAGVQWSSLVALMISTAHSRQITSITGEEFHGIVGAQLFENYAVEIDFQSQQIRLHSAKNFRYEGSGEVLEMSVKGRKPYIAASVKINADTLPETGEFLLDLGSSEGLDIRNLSPSIASIDWQAMPKRYVSGLGGENQYPVGRVQDLQIGSQTVRFPITTFEIHPNQANLSSNKKLSGRIGIDILQRFKLIFNYSKKQLILEPNPHTSDRFEADMSGLRLLADESFPPSSVLIHTVYPNTPAADLGLRSGDRLWAIDGSDVATLTLEGIRQKLIASPGTARTLLIERNGQKFEVSLILRSLI